MEGNQLYLVRNQAEEKQKQLVKHFEQAMNFVQNERNQLDQIQGYEQDYLIKIKNEESQWRAETTQRYRQFCHQLAGTIIGQKSKLAEAEIKLEQMRKYLADQQQRINVLNDLIERGEKEREKLQDSIEQKEMDEFSTRKYR
ncbi:MAG: flagellar export protein FliJ [Cellvibrionaceae bacterium]